MIRRYCDVCDKQIGRDVVSDRYHPSLYMRGENWAAEVVIRKGTIWNGGDLCQECLLKILNEGKEYAHTPRLAGSHAL